MDEQETMELLKNASFTVKDDITTVFINTNDNTLVNLVRTTILSEIETYSIEYVTFYLNDTSLKEEIIALRLGQLPINNEQDLLKFFYKTSRIRFLVGKTGSNPAPAKDEK